MCCGSISSAESASRGADSNDKCAEGGVTRLGMSVSSRRWRFSHMSAIEDFDSSPKNSGRPAGRRVRAQRTVFELVAAARLVAMNDVPHPPLLEKTATIRPFFFGASTFLLEN